MNLTKPREIGPLLTGTKWRGMTCDHNCDVMTVICVTSASSMFEEAEILVRTALASTTNPGDAFRMSANLGEVLRAKGDLENAVHTLRAVVGTAERTVGDEVSVYQVH